MRTRVLAADGPKPKKTHKKYDENIGRHLKKKKIGTPKVFQRLSSSLGNSQNYSWQLHECRNGEIDGLGSKIGPKPPPGYQMKAHIKDI